MINIFDIFIRKIKKNINFLCERLYYLIVEIYFYFQICIFFHIFLFSPMSPEERKTKLSPIRKNKNTQNNSINKINRIKLINIIILINDDQSFYEI